MRTPSYSRSQTLWPLWVVLPGVAAMALILARQAPDGQAVWHLLVGVLPPLLILMALGRLRIQVDTQALEWRFGFLGWPRWRLVLADITKVEVVHTGWSDGWGIKRGREGWLYNASGFGAVRIRTHDGRSIRLGSDEPEKLASFVAARLPHRQ